ncbi:MAG TPA: polysaccharide biosynthesis tyrosine autokinase [Burkholderiaceae bacterium]|nr:polysaccharide biosynthesis tyrosine autokinase [Burkholderiaceae bacterium]
MAKFRESISPEPAQAEPSYGPSTSSTTLVADRAMGDLLREARNLSAEQIEQVVQYQREHHVRFGEAAIALGFVSANDVLYALSQQFHYIYAPDDLEGVSQELVTLRSPFSPQAESFRGIRSQLMMRVFNEAEPRRALAVVSPNRADGKTFFSANLGVTLAQLGGRTLVVDADLRGPRQHELFGLSNNAGLSGLLSGRVESQVIQQIQALPSLYVLPVGVTPPNPLELIERPAFSLLVRELLSKFDHVVVDTPAAVHGADASALAARCGAALVLARKDKSRVVALQDLVSTLAESPAKLAGVIMNEF